MNLIAFVFFESLIVLSVDTYQDHSNLLGVRMIALWGLHFE